MQFSRESQPRHAIRRYTADSVWIMDQTHSGSLAVSADDIISDWQCSDVDALSEATLAPLLALQPEVLVIGVGDTVRFPDAATMRSVMHAGIGIEVMNDGAAIRTFNVMLAEQRSVVLALVRGDAS